MVVITSIFEQTPNPRELHSGVLSNGHPADAHADIGDISKTAPSVEDREPREERR